MAELQESRDSPDLFRSEANGPEFLAPASRLRLVLMRPEDNLVLGVSGVGLGITTGDDKVPRLVRREDATLARLIVTFPPQHIAEQVFQEHLQGGNAEQPLRPAGARFAAPSRLAFDIPAGEQIEVTVAGILLAMSRLPLAVAPLAASRRIWYAWQELSGVAPAAPLALEAAFAQVEPGVAATGIALTTERLRASRVLAATLLGSGVRALHPEVRRALLAVPAGDRAAALTEAARLSEIDYAGIVRLLRNPDPRPPLSTETAIEIPSRLQLSPSVDGGWAHATSPENERGDGTGPVELWHSRLGVRVVGDGGTVSVDETDPTQRIVRAIWTRDLTAWGGPLPPPTVPFRTSTTPPERYDIVGLSTGPGLPIWASPNPVDVNRLALSSLGGFVDLRGAWPLTPPYGVAEWQHRTTLGRDQYVKVVKYGYLFAFGHRAVFVTETRRKVDPTLPESGDTAILWQREFIILRERTRGYDDRSMPFTSVTLAPPSTPDLDFPGDDPAYFWPMVGGKPFRFTVSAVDHDGATHVFTAPLLWVAAPMSPGTAADVLSAYGLVKDGQGFKHVALGDDRVELDLAGKPISVAPSAPSASAAYETRVLRFAGDPGEQTATPTLLFADLIVPAVAAVSGQKSPLRLAFAKPYLDSAFDGVANAGEVVLQTARDAAAGTVSFAGSSDRSGGFLDPSQTIDGVSRRLGPVADVANSALGTVDPAKLFGGVGKLFGLFDLADVLKTLGLGDMPAYAAKALDIGAALDGDLSRLPGLLPDEPAPVATAKTALQDAATALDTLTASPPADFDTAKAQFQTLIDTKLVPALQQAGQDAVLGSLERAQQAIVGRTLDTLQTLLTPPAPLPLSPAEMLARLARGEPVASLLSHVHLEWSPPLQEWPAGAAIFTPSFAGKPGKLLLAVDVRGGDLVASPSAEIVAQLTNFSLQLLPGTPLLQIGFQRLLFKASTGSKTDVDVVLDDLGWQGILGFVETLKDLIPLDGFSDPPSIEVDSSGIGAGFSVGLPNLAVGVFNLSNLSLGADLKLPFVGDAPTVGFAFCSRERPFTLAVMFLGGGGFFGLRLNPKGVVLLEASLEFGACLALDFGVASGSVSCMAGVYLRLEGSDGSLTGYLRIRGEVEVLELISAVIEMYMGLTYEFGSGKVVGRATISVEVEVLFFSASVQISCERKFAGSGGDPTFAQVLGPYADDGPWVTYCQAFAEV